MRAVAFVVPGDIDTRTGGYIYDKRIAAGLRALGWRVDVRGCDVSAIADGTIAIIDGLALPLVADHIGAAASRLRVVPLVHLPLALEAGLDGAEAARRHAIERCALDAAARIIVTGRATIGILEAAGIDRDRIALVEPGTDPAPLSRGSRADAVSLLCVAALTPGKGHERLLRALAAVPSRQWTLTCAGSLDRDRATVERVKRLIRSRGLEDRIALAGELDDAALARAYDGADAFVLATLRETYGMAVAEAIAHGLPVVSTTTGAIPEIVGRGGLLAAPDDEPALAASLSTIVTNRRRREELGRHARAARGRLRTWADAAAAMAAVLRLL